ncbi:hypothetical protein U1Q18_047766 [Sarracenia purpurea var. burkii]
MKKYFESLLREVKEETAKEISEAVEKANHFVLINWGLDGSSGSNRNNSEPEPQAKVISQRDDPVKPCLSIPISASAPPLMVLNLDYYTLPTVVFGCCKN